MMAAENPTGLASLSAAYTDSEGEEEREDEKEQERSPIMKSNPASSTGTPATATPASAPSKPPQLVAYDDPAIVDFSDDENKSPQPMDISDDESDLEPVADKQNTPPPAPARPSTHSHKAIDLSILPPEPTGHCSKALQEKMVKFLDMKRDGKDMNDVIERKKEYRNPSLYEKLIQFCDLDEFGTNYPANLYNPHMYGADSYYDELSRVQKIEMDKREKERKEKTRIEFVSGTKKPVPSTSSIEEELKKRKSKWDQVGTSSQAVPLKPAGIVNHQALKTTTHISAFGSLTKIKGPPK